MVSGWQHNNLPYTPKANSRKEGKEHCNVITLSSGKIVGSSFEDDKVEKEEIKG